MKLKIALVVVFSMLFGGIVSAAGLYGTFEGFQIVRVQSNGETLAAEDVPAVNLNGRTMVPIYMLRNLGLGVSWDGKTETVNITSNNTASETYDVVSISKTLKDTNVDYVEMISNGENFTQISFYYNGSFEEIPDDVYNQIAWLSTLSGAASLRIVDNKEKEVTILTDYLRDFYNGKITGEELQSYYVINGQRAGSTSSDSQNNTQPAPVSANYPELYSNDGKTFLGILTSNEYDTDGIFNEYGTYGSKYSKDSIWNEYGTYGSKYSSDSAFNDLATDPPIIVLDGEIIGYLTTNTTISNGISPLALLDWLDDNGY